MFEFLPSALREALERVNTKFVYELRLRAGKPTTVNFRGIYRYLGAYGLTDKLEESVVVSAREIEETVYRAGKGSVYAVEEQIKQGFITAEGGVRLGLAGKFVSESGKTVTVRSFTSLCIRIPHEIVGCGDGIYRACLEDGVKNLLIASPPGCGKTTILRDLARKVSERTGKNILICDERGEISALNTGKTSDILSYADKRTAFEVGIRAMRPDVIVTDELAGEDILAVKKAVRAGVKVIASAHFSQKDDIPSEFSGVFERFVFLKEGQIGEISIMYDRDIKELCVANK